MPLYGELLVAAGIAVGLVGIVVPILPGSLLVGMSIGIWAIVVGGWAWLVFAVAALVLGIGELTKYLVAGRGLKTAGVPTRTILVGALTGIVGFFVVPVVGLFAGFVAGSYVAELARTRALGPAWRGALAALRAAATSILIELLAALTAAGIWVTFLLIERT